MSKDDPTGGSRGWHIPLFYSSVQSIRLRICLAAVVNAIEALRLCNGIMRGDSSAVIYTYGDLCSVLVSLLHILYPSRKVNTFTDSEVLAFDVDSHRPSPSKLALPDVVKDLLDEYLPSDDNSQRALVLKKYSAFLSALVKDIQSVLWCCLNGGLRHFSFFSLPILKTLSFEGIKTKFAALIGFLKLERLLVSSMASKWEAELMVLYRTVIQPLDPSVVTSVDALTF